MKEFNIKRHHITTHPEYENIVGISREEKINCFKRGITAQQQIFKKLHKESEVVSEISYDLSLLIAKTSRPFTEGEFIKQCLLTVGKKISPEITKKVENISLSRTTVQRHVVEMADDIFDQFKEKTEDIRYFSLAIDESTDISSTAQLMIFFRGVTNNFEIYEELLAVSSLKDRTTGSDLLTSLLNECEKAGLDLKKLAGITTDGAPSMIGANNGMVSLLKNSLGNRNLELFRFHCIIHQQNLCGKDLGFDHVMKVVVSVVNFIKNRGLNHRQFKSFLEEIEAEYHDLIYYCEARWLSRGKTLQRFSDLLEEIEIFLNEKQKPFQELSNDRWLCDFAFLVDITTHLNILNLKLQVKNQFISEMANHVESFENKLTLFQKNLTDKILHHFPTCQKYFPRHSADYDFYLSKIQLLKNVFESRFADFKKMKSDFQLFADPFSVNIDEVNQDIQLELIDLQSSDHLRNKFKESDLQNFYKCLQKVSYPNLIQKVAYIASLFGSTYVCEQTFSVMNMTKSKQRNRLSNDNLHSILRLATTNLTPNILKIVNKKQCHIAPKKNKINYFN